MTTDVSGGGRRCRAGSGSRGSRKTTRSRRPGRSSRSWRAWTETSSAAGALTTSLVWSHSGRLAGRANTRIVVTPAELDQVEEAIERLLAPYVLRKDDPSDTHPAEARWVRVLRYTLPAADPEAPGGPTS